jgi:PAS domain S-box-containing protein
VRVPLQSGSRRNEFERIGAAFNLMAESLQVRQSELKTELGRSKSAYAVLDLVLNSMHDGLVAISNTGQLLMFNEAAARLLPLTGPPSLPQQWPERFGIYHPDGATLYPADELPLVGSAHGESALRLQLFIRNDLVPEGRLVQCNWQPIHGADGIRGGLAVFTDITELQRLQDEQAEQQRKLVEAQRLGRIGNWEMDLSSGRLWWSDELHDLFGVAREDFDGTLNAFMQCVHPDDRALLKPARDAALRDGKVMNVEYRVVKPDGIAWIHEIAQARRNDRGEPVWFGGVVQDTTVRKNGEQALRESQRELQAYTQMLQRATEAAQAIAAQTSLEAALQEVADQARRVIGTQQAVVSLDDGAAPVRRSFSGLGDAQVPVAEVLALPLVHRDGHRIGMLTLSAKQSGEFTQRDEYVALELAQLASIAIDNAQLFAQIRELNAGLEARIAERTAELARQERLFRTLAEQAPEIVWNTDATGTQLMFLNRAWYDLVGGTPQDWVGKSGMEAIHPDDRAEVAQHWLRSSKTLDTIAGVRRIKARDGSYHTTSYKAAPVLDEHGAVAFWVGIDADITEFKAIEQALRSSNEELEAFSYSVSHDLRAPLGAIGGFSRALALKLDGHCDDRVKHYISRIQAGVGKMEQLIEALLALARVVRAPLNFEPVNISAIAREVLEGLQMQHPGRQVAVRVQDALMAQGDMRLLRVVMENLLGNAWKFTSRGETAQIEVGKLEDNSAFFVRDNGVGFDMAYADKLFSAFQRLHTEAEFPGTGVGLATVRRIVTRHQGRVWVESLLGQGTTFFFALSEKAPPVWLANQDLREAVLKRI